jgi:hypothetical protein
MKLYSIDVEVDGVVYSLPFWTWFWDKAKKRVFEELAGRKIQPKMIKKVIRLSTTDYEKDPILKVDRTRSFKRDYEKFLNLEKFKPEVWEVEEKESESFMFGLRKRDVMEFLTTPYLRKGDEVWIKKVDGSLERVK